MKEKDLLKAIGKIDEKYLAEAQERAVKAEDSSEGESIVMGVDIMKERKTGKIFGRIATVCAVAVLAVGTALYIGRDDFSGGSDSDIEKEQLIVLVNGMTEKELESVASDELSIIREVPVGHTVQLELWSNEDYLDFLINNKGLYSEEEYNECYELYTSTEFTGAIHSAVVDGRYYTGCMPPDIEYDGGPLEYLLADVIIEAGASGVPPLEEFKFDTFEEFKEWYRKHLDKFVDGGKRTQANADKEYEDMLIIFESVMNGSYSVLDMSAGEYIVELEHKEQWEYDKTDVEQISQYITEYTFYDEEMDENFIVHVTLPPDYDKRKVYPAFVLTDGVWRFGNHPELRKTMENDEADDVILVSVSCDFSLDATDNAVRAKYFCEERDLFLDFITDNLMPYLGECYQLDYSKSALYGHSLGGVFTHYAVFNSDMYANQPFGSYIIGSPAFWSPYFQPLESSEGYSCEYGYFERNSNLDKKLFICGGEFEDPYYADHYGDCETTLEGIESLMKRLEEYGVTSAECKIYEKASHYDFIPEMLCEFLKKYYPA